MCVIFPAENHLNTLTGASAATSFHTYFQPAPGAGGTWVFRGDDARQSLLNIHSNTGVTRTDGDSVAEDEDVDEFASVDASPLFAAVCEALATGAVGDAVLARVAHILNDVPSREAAAVVMRALMTVRIS
jgi:hypothetical protein